MPFLSPRRILNISNTRYEVTVGVKRLIINPNYSLFQILSREERMTRSSCNALAFNKTYPSTVHSNILFKGTIDKNCRIVPKSDWTYFLAVILELVLLLTTYISSKAVSIGTRTAVRNLEIMSVAILRAREDVPPT